MAGVGARRAVRWRWLAAAAVVGQVLFVAGWIVAGALEGHGYSVSRDDISDLTALTAQHAWIMRSTQGIGAVLTIAFSLGALAPSMAVPGRRAALGPWLLAGSLIGLDNLSDAFFRLDCRHADPGCSASAAAASWQGTIHVVVGGVAAVLTIAAAFALAFRMRIVSGWQDLSRPTLGFSVVLLVSFVVYGALAGKDGPGYAQRAAALLLPAGVVVLAMRVRRLAGREQSLTGMARPTP